MQNRQKGNKLITKYFFLALNHLLLYRIMTLGQKLLEYLDMPYTYTRTHPQKQHALANALPKSMAMETSISQPFS